MPRPSITSTTNPWSASHCDSSSGRWARTTRPQCGPPYGSSSTGIGSAGSAPPGVNIATRRSFGPADRYVGAAHDDRGLGRAREGVQRLGAPHEPGHRQRLVDGLAHQHGEIAGGHGPVLAHGVAHPIERAGGGEPPDVHLGRLVGGAHPHVVGRREHRVDLQARRRHRLAVDQQRAGVVAVAHGEQPPARQPGRHALGDVGPALVVVGPHDLGRAVLDVDREHLHVTLVARLHEGERRALVGPRHGDDVLERVAVPRHVDPFAVERRARAG